MKLVFMGTPSFTLPVLEALSKKHEILAVYTRAPKPAGHGMKLTKSAVHEWGENHNITVYTPTTLKDEQVQKQIADMGADALITTEKDAVRFPRFETSPVKCLYLRISIEILKGGENFSDIINRICFNRNTQVKN